MKHARLGESLWNEWDGLHYDQKLSEEVPIIFTEGHVDIQDDIVKRALASALQRFGIFDSLGQAYRAIDSYDTQVTLGYAGYVGGENFLSACDAEGFTSFGEKVDAVYPITWTEVNNFDE